MKNKLHSIIADVFKVRTFPITIGNFVSLQTLKSKNFVAFVAPY